MFPPVMPTYARADLAFERGEGAFLFTADGRRYLDFGAGVAVTSLGHAHPTLVAALTEQARKVWHTSNLYRVPGQETLAAKLIANCFADTVFFANSGAEAVEGAIKTARKYHYANGNPRRWRIVTIESAFHGRTLATIAAGGQAKHLEGFGPKVDGFDQVSFGNLNELRAAIGEETAAIMLEPVQGESGIRVPPETFLKGVREAADEFGVLVIFDEVQTGVGRTGHLFAHQEYGIAPDIMALAKGLGGGFPVGAVLATAEAAKGMTAGSHGSTYGGNPLAMAVANAVIDTVTADGFLDGVRRTAALLRSGLTDLARRHPRVLTGWRGKGLMLGLQCVPPVAEVIVACRNNGLLLVPAGDNVARILPPLVIGKAEVDEALAIMDKTFSAIE